jgi:hypothetical protein
MRISDPDADQVLERARRALSPGDGVSERVREAVRRSLAVSGTLDATERSESGAPRTSAAPDAGASLGAWTGPAKFALVAALAGATGVGGYVLGFDAGRAAEKASHTPAVSSAPAPIPSALPVPVDTPPVAPAKPAIRSVRAESAGPSPSSPSPSLPAPIETETRELARIERALRDGNSRLALGLLAELDRTVPKGQLTEERQAARVVAHCTEGNDSAPKLARTFAARYPGSAYLARISQACERAGAETKADP